MKIEKPHNPVNKNDIKVVDIKLCPYCCKPITRYFDHFRTHFYKSEIKKIIQFLIRDIWKITIPKCKNPECNEDSKMIKYFDFANFCNKCGIHFKGSRGQKLLYDKKKWENHLINRGKAISYKMQEDMKTEDGRKKWENARNITGKKNSINMKRFSQTEKGKLIRKQAAKLQSIVMKEKIANGSFTPNITNSWTHWDAKVIVENIEYKFRSSWESCFWLSNQYLEYEKLRIPYISEEGKNRTYIADFYDIKTKILYEIKPKKSFLLQQHKMDAIIEYCLNNNIKFIWINENNILEYIDRKDFQIEENLIQYNKMLKGVNAKT